MNDTFSDPMIGFMVLIVMLKHESMFALLDLLRHTYHTSLLSFAKVRVLATSH